MLRLFAGPRRCAPQVIAALAQDILSKLAPQFDVDEVSKRYPTTYKESMNTVLTQVRGRRARGARHPARGGSYRHRCIA